MGSCHIPPRAIKDSRKDGFIMTISCDLVKDLLPLYHDGICSENSKQLVEEHLSECGNCKSILAKIKDTTLDNQLQRERNDVVGHHAQAVKRKSLIAGISIASVMAFPIVVCLIVNIALDNALDWFFIVLTALMTAASLTVVPLIIEERKGLWTLGSFTGSLTLLLLTCCLYSGGDWFFISIISVLLGLSVLFGPYVVIRIPMKGFMASNNGLLVMAVDTILLYAVVIVSGLYGNDSYYWYSAVMITTVCLLFPWGLFLMIRYLKANTFVRAGLCVIFGGVFLSMMENIINWILGNGFRIQFRNANLLVWNENFTDANIFLLTLISGVVIGGVLLVVGLLRKKKV